MMKRKTVLSVVLAAATAIAGLLSVPPALAQSQTAQKPPNILVIFGDDVGIRNRL
jgi:hypothetical protein